MGHFVSPFCLADGLVRPLRGLGSAYCELRELRRSAVVYDLCPMEMVYVGEFYGWIVGVGFLGHALGGVLESLGPQPRGLGFESLNSQPRDML